MDKYLIYTQTRFPLRLADQFIFLRFVRPLARAIKGKKDPFLCFLSAQHYSPKSGKSFRFSLTPTYSCLASAIKTEPARLELCFPFALTRTTYNRKGVAGGVDCACFRCRIRTSTRTCSYLVLCIAHHFFIRCILSSRFTGRIALKSPKELKPCSSHARELEL